MMDRPSESKSDNGKARELFIKASGCLETDPESARTMLREASSLGCTASMVLLGNILIDGTADEKKEALKLFEQAYEAGDNMGSRNLGYCYAIGLGTDTDKKKAAEWYRISAEAGNAKAQCNLGVLYMFGNGVEKDASKAAEWYRRSSENGYSRGMTNYACLLRDGNGVPKDTEKAVYWFTQSGSPRAKRLLAQMYLSGADVPKDIGKARELLESASSRDRKAMFILGDLIYDEDKEKAVSLFRRSAEKGFDDAIRRLKELGLEVPPKKTRF